MQLMELAEEQKAEIDKIIGEMTNYVPARTAIPTIIFRWAADYYLVWLHFAPSGVFCISSMKSPLLS